MDNPFEENWNKFYQCISKPMFAITELNVNTYNNLSKNIGTLEEFTQAKKPNDFLWSQLKLTYMNQFETVTYIKKIGDILSDSMAEINETFSDLLKKTAEKTSNPID